MSVLRLCAFPKCQTARIFLERNVRHLLYADHCHVCLRIRDGSHRRVAETPWSTYRRNYSAVIPKKEDGKKRIWEQSQLLDVLEARILQLQSNVVLDVKRSKVQFVKVSKAGREAAPRKGPAGRKGAAADPPAQKHGPSRWMEKLKEEKSSKASKLLQHMQKATDKPAKAQATDAGPKRPSVTMKTIPASKMADAKQQLPLKSRVVAVATAAPPVVQSRSRKKEPPAAEEQARGAQLMRDREGNGYSDAQLSVRCYLEACSFSGDVTRAQRCLLGHHHQLNRRKLLSIGGYNFMMKVWANRGSLNQIGRLFVLMEEAGLKPNLTSYAAALECMGRKPDPSPRVILRCLEQLEEVGLSVEDLFRHCVFRQDEREVVLKAIRMVEPAEFSL
ncbi:hypothetical protein AAFF_G00219270 [Aldrovandia affinis]|uniref:Pentatricopeptide repeat-containing protein n=1 Tax=Aldrovandia affinis TaxID=143900 RepID=A0AAD7W4K7_9TELE|nr:hypothetical protein AAFF_G00219270 [Aldrovandia affinis]